MTITTTEHKGDVGLNSTLANTETHIPPVQTQNLGQEVNSNIPPDTAPQDSNNVTSAFEQYIDISKLTATYAKDLGALSLGELKLNAAATAETVKFSIAMIPIGLIFYVSLLASITYTTYFLTGMPMVAVGVLVGIQLLLLAIMKYRINAAKSLKGFPRTKRHFKEMKDELTEVFK